MTINDLINEFETMTFYIFEQNDESVGVSAIKFLDTKTAGINWAYVLPKHQRKGVGTGLINHLENIAKNMGISKLQLLTAEKAHWAIKFYEKLGYKSVKRISRPWGFDVMMIKNLYLCVCARIDSLLSTSSRTIAARRFDDSTLISAEMLILPCSRSLFSLFYSYARVRT